MSGHIKTQRIVNHLDFAEVHQQVCRAWEAKAERQHRLQMTLKKHQRDQVYHGNA